MSSRACFNHTKQHLSGHQAFLPVDRIELELLKQDCLHTLSSATARLYQHLLRLGEDFVCTASKDLSKGRIPTISELHQLALLLEADEIWLDTFERDLDAQEKTLFSVPSIFNRKLLTSLREFISDDGSINERDFKELRELSDEILELEAFARRKISEIQKHGDKKFASSGDFDIINERYVLPVPSDSYNSTYGPIVHRSRSGMTLMVEPPEMRTFSLRRSELLSKRDWLVFQKCRELGERLAPLAANFDLWSDFALDFDRLQTLAAYASLKKFCRPQISKDMGLELKGAFHPLVDDCVANDVTIDSTHQGVILSGPNTGGKTVLLKSVALSVALFRLGCWSPAKSAKIFPYTQLYFFSHDLQDINQGLSSFSSEVKNYSSLVDDLNHDSLIIIDEIFNSTSSEEASALAVSLLEFLAAKFSPQIVLSTHHHGIKTMLSSMGNYLSCHMAVDGHGQPLYRIVWGSPGSSRGIDTFARLSRHTHWGKALASRAKELLGSQVFDYESALTEINAQKAEYFLKQQEADKQLQSLKSEQAAFNLQKETQLLQAKELLYKKYEKIVSKTQEEIDRFKSSKSSPRRMLDTLAAGKAELRPQKAHGQKIPDNLLQLPPDATGLRVWSNAFSKTGTALQDKGDKILVDFKGLKSWCKKKDLQLLRDQANDVKHQVSVQVQRELIGKTTLDCRGHRLEAFQSEVNICLQELLSGDIPYLDIVHGHGDGILKKWLRQFLKHEHDYSWTPLDGNDGATRVELKKS